MVSCRIGIFFEWEGHGYGNLGPDDVFISFMLAFGHQFWVLMTSTKLIEVHQFQVSLFAQQLSCICDGTAAGGASHLTADVLDSFLAG